MIIDVPAQIMIYFIKQHIMIRDGIIVIDILLAIEAIEDEDERAYIGQLFEKYSVRVKRYAIYILHNEQDADDATGNVFLKIIKYRHKFIGISDTMLKGRIALITRCTCLDYMEKRHNHSYQSIYDYTEDDDGNIQDYEIPDDLDILRNMIQTETVEKLYEALQVLQSPANEIVMMRYFDEMSSVEIADILSMNDSTVRTILERSLKKMKKVLEVYYRDQK